MVYWTLLAALHPGEDYEELAVLLAPLVAAQGGGALGSASASAVAQARARLGADVLREVFETVAQPVADLATDDAFLAGRRLVAVDGFVLDVPDTPSNVESFGYPGSAGGRAGSPQVRVCALVECATQAVFAARMGPVGGKGSGERSLAKGLFSELADDLLVLADAGFYSFDLWDQAHQSGAGLLWRVGAGLRLPVVERQEDGSYLSIITRPGMSPARRDRILHVAGEQGVDALDDDAGDVHVVRVVEYDVTDRGDAQGGGVGELFCLITNILDARQVPASDLAGAYHARWEAEEAFKDVKNELRPAGHVLRSRSAELVQAEIYGMLTVQWALAALIAQAAAETGTDPRRIKYKRAIRIVRRHATSVTAFPP